MPTIGNVFWPVAESRGAAGRAERRFRPAAFAGLAGARRTDHAYWPRALRVKMPEAARATPGHARRTTRV
jgi:hypothetical protein